MQITGIYWLPAIIDKLIDKHQVEIHEVEEVLSGHARFRRIQRGRVQGEHLYSALGQTDAGRYLIVFFIRKPTDIALVISARDMNDHEQRRFRRTK
ncbi:MAG: BrnT family toxin [Caldilineaceae bacterium]|nr:BrnT family toxin [Caldilineaceae bacterium]